MVGLAYVEDLVRVMTRCPGILQGAPEVVLALQCTVQLVPVLDPQVVQLARGRPAGRGRPARYVAANLTVTTLAASYTIAGVSPPGALHRRYTARMGRVQAARPPESSDYSEPRRLKQLSLAEINKLALDGACLSSLSRRPYVMTAYGVAVPAVRTPGPCFCA